MQSRTAALITLGILLGCAVPRQSQGQQGTLEPVSHQQVISANPFGLLFEWFNAEYERKVTNTVTAGIQGGWLSLDLDEGEVDYSNVGGFLRYYPQGAALTGFYVGSRLGVHRVEADDEEATVLGFGIDIGYSWLLGINRAFYIGVGIGANRLFGLDMEDASATLPTIRLMNIGIAF